MNLSRLLLLLSLLASSLLLALSQLAPPVLERQTRDFLFARLDSEVRFLEQRERAAALERELAATHIAEEPSLRLTFEASDGTARAIADTFARVAQQVIDAEGVSFHTLTLVNADGAVVGPAAQRGSITVEEVVAASQARLALERRAVVHHAFNLTGRLFTSVTVPIPGTAGNLLGAVVLVQEVTASTVAERRTGSDTNLAYFSRLDIVADTMSDTAHRERVQALVRRTNAGNIGRPGRLQQAEVERMRPTAGQGNDSIRVLDRMVLMAPVTFDVSNAGIQGDPEFGVVVLVESEWPSGTLFGYLAENRAFDDGGMLLWTFLAAALGLFFLGIILDDIVRGQIVNRLASAVEVIAQSNHPQPLSVNSYPSLYRPLVKAVNTLMEEFRSRAAAARKAREEAEEAHRRVEAVTGTLPDVSHLNHGDSPAERARLLSRDQSFASALPEAAAAVSTTATSNNWADPHHESPSTELLPGRSALASGTQPMATSSPETSEVLPSRLSVATARTDAMPVVTPRQAPPPLPPAPLTPAGTQLGMEPVRQAPAPPLHEPINPAEFDFTTSSINRIAAEFLHETGASENSGLTGIDPPSDEGPVPTDFMDVQPVSMELVGGGVSDDELMSEASDMSDAEGLMEITFEPTRVGDLDQIAREAEQTRGNAPSAAGTSAPAAVSTRPSPLIPSIPPPVRPMRPTRTSPLSSLADPSAADSERPATSTPAPDIAQPAATMDFAAQTAAAGTENSSVSALIDSIMTRRPDVTSSSGPIADNSDPNAITSPPLMPELSRALIEETSSLPSLASANVPSVATQRAIPAVLQDEVPEPGDPAPPARPNNDDNLLPAPDDAAERRPEHTMALTPAAALLPAHLDDEPSEELLDAFERVGLTQSRVQIPTVPPADPEPGVSREATRTTDHSALIEAEDLINRAEARLARLSSTAEESFLLFDEFVKARRQCGESTADLTFEKFTRKLERSREQLKERYVCDQIDFSVAVVDGKATLKARPQRG